MPQGKTDNLMDYANGNSLFKYQWDLIHDPQRPLFAWTEEMEEGAMKELKGTYTIYVGDSIMTEKKVFINTNKTEKIYVKYEPAAGDTGTYINVKLIYRPVWSKNDISWPGTTWGKINVNTKMYFELDSLPEGKYTVLLKNRNEKIDTINFYLRPKKYDFACSVCGRDLSLTLAKLKLIFPGNKNITQLHVDYLNDALKNGGFTTCKRHAHFFSQVYVESGNFMDFEENYKYRLYDFNSAGDEIGIYATFGTQSNDSYKTLYSQNFWDINEHLNYTGASACKHLYNKKDTCTDITDKTKRYIGVGSVTKTRNGYTVTFPASFKKDTTGTYIKYIVPDSRKCGENLFNVVYKDINGNTQPGDGWKYRGRGAIQVTGRSNYKKVSDKANTAFTKAYNWESNPDELKDKIDAIIYSAVAWFLNAFNPISTLDNKTTYQVTKTVNAKQLDKEGRAKKYEELMNDGQLYNCETK